MAAKKVNVETFSRFSALGIESEEEIEKEKELSEKKSNAEKNAKKKNRKKKKAAAQNASTNELRNMAFSKPVSASAIKTIHQQNHPMPDVNNRPPPQESVNRTYSPNVATESNDSNVCGDRSWEEWKNKDESYVADQFQRDLEAALRLSSGGAADSQKHGDVNSKGTKKKNSKKPTMSLEEFSRLHIEPKHSMEQAPAINNQARLNGYCPEELDPNYFQYDPALEKTSSNHLVENDEQSATQNKKSKKKKKKATENKAALSEVFSELSATNNTSKISNSSALIHHSNGMDAASLAAWQNDMENKDKEIQKLRNVNVQLMGELTQVKKRNKQFCVILAQGEMKEKSEILLQVDELNNIKNELSAEVQTMHSALEQERSKVSILKQELQKYQGSRTKSICEDK